MLTSSSAAQALFDKQENLVRSGRGVVLSQQAIANATQNMTIKAKLATVGLKALSVAGNMLLFAGISMGISALFKGIDYLIHRTEKIREAANTAMEEYKSATSEIESLTNKQKENNRLLEEANNLANNDAYKKRLEAENEELQRQIDLEEIKAQKAKEEADKKARKTLESKTYEYDNSSRAQQSGGSRAKSASRRTSKTNGDIVTATDWYLDQAESTGVVDEKLEDYINIIKEQRENLDLTNPVSKELYDNLTLLLDRYRALYPEITNVSNATEDGVNNVNKMTVSLSEMEGASDKIGKLSSAFKELSDDGHITLKTLGEIQTATGLSGDEWEEYQSKLQNAKKGSAEFNQVMGDLTFKILENTFGLKGLTEENQKNIEAVLRDSGVTNANAVAQSVIARAKAENASATAVVTGKTLEEFVALVNEGRAAGWTAQQINELIAKHINLNNAKLSVEDKIAAITRIGQAAGWASAYLKYMIKLVNQASGVFEDNSGLTEQEKAVRQGTSQVYLNKAGLWDTGEVPEFTPPEIATPNFSGSGGSGSSKGSGSGGSGSKTPFDDTYYSTVNAWIDENQKEIERFEKDREALNRQFENALDTGNKEQAEILRDKLAENAKMQKDILHQQNEAHRITQGQLLQSLYQYAPSLSGKSWDEISEVDLTNIENTLSKTSEMATDDNAKNQAKKDLNYFKGIVDDLKAINDAMESNSEDWWSNDEKIKDFWTSQIDLQNEYFEENLSNQKAFNKLSKKEEVVAYSQAIADNKRYQEQILNDTTLSENAKLALIKEIDDTIIEYEKEIYDLRTDMIDELFDIRIERLNSQASLLKAHYALVNSIAEEQHSLNKELLEAETVGARMSEHERQSLFSKEEYTKLSKKLNEVLKDADEIQSNYIADLKSATKDTISQITNEYERQYELKEKEYNIVKAELSLAKAQEELENAKNEKTQKVWNGSKWVYDSSIQDVIDAANNLEDAKYELLKAQTEQTQQQAIGSLESESDLLQTKQNQLAEAFGGLAEETNASKVLLTEALQSIANVDIPTFENIIGIIGDDLLNLFGISGGTVNQIKWSSPLYQNNIAPVGYKSGGKNVPKGIARFDEDGLGSELIIDKDGVLTQFNAGDTIFSKEMVDKLWDMLSSNTFVPSFTPNVKIPDMTQIVNNNTPQDNRSFSVNGITVEDYKGKELLKQVAQYFCRM